MGRDVETKSLLTERRIARIDSVVAARVRGITVVLEEVHDPHNLAAVLRTAEGLGLTSIHAIAARGGFRPNAAVTQGADKWIDLCLHRDSDACADALLDAGYALLAGEFTPTARPLHEVGFDRRVALCFGNEHAGLSAAMARRCQESFRIPMAGFSQSLNVSVAVGITLAHALEWRRKHGLGSDLDEPERAALRERFYRLATHVKWEE
jgi:tRNA (guanosine-2'-O-)-methyltransferase